MHEACEVMELEEVDRQLMLWTEVCFIQFAGTDDTTAKEASLSGSDVPIWWFWYMQASNRNTTTAITSSTTLKEVMLWPRFRD